MFDVLGLDQGFEVVPEFERERGVLLGVFTDVHGGQSPELFFSVDAKVLCGLFQPLLRLDFLEVIEAQTVEGVAVSVLVQERCCDHRIDNAAVDREA